MKVKTYWRDFVVREIAALPLGNGRHAAYRLTKCGMGTPAVIDRILALWNLPRRAVASAGLKDRHAVTTQHLSIENGPEKDLAEGASLSHLDVQDVQAAGFELQYLGQCARPITAHDIAGNEFVITLRGLSHASAQRMVHTAQAGTLCVPNYFDDQRFGSVGESGEFVAHRWCQKNYERALFLALAEHNPADRSEEREQKQILRDNWGNWQACKDALERSNRRSVVTYLVDHPEGFKKACGLLRQDMRGLYVSAFQSGLWNELAFRWLAGRLPTADWHSIEGRAGPLRFPQQVPAELLDELNQQTLPLPSGRKMHWPAAQAQLLDDILKPFEIQRHELRIVYPRDVFFSRADRQLLLAPQGLHAELEDDVRIAPDRSDTTEHAAENLDPHADPTVEVTAAAAPQALRLAFRLDRGQYATMLLKALEAATKET